MDLICLKHDDDILISISYLIDLKYICIHLSRTIICYTKNKQKNK